MNSAESDLPVAQLRNLGPKSAQRLASIGVETAAQLAAIGAIEAYALIQAQSDNVSLNLLYALHGALEDERWDWLSAETKASLRDKLSQIQFGDAGSSDV